MKAELRPKPPELINCGGYTLGGPSKRSWRSDLERRARDEDLSSSLSPSFFHIYLHSGSLAPETLLLTTNLRDDYWVETLVHTQQPPNFPGDVSK